MDRAAVSGVLLLMLVCNETVTFVRHIAEPDGDRYECEAVVGVSWYGKHGDRLSAQDGEAPRCEYTVRIPAALVPKELPRAGDLAVRGILAEYPDRKCLDGREWFRISYVGDNRRGRLLPHLVVKNE